MPTSAEPTRKGAADVRKTAEEKRRFVRALLQAEAGIRNQEIRKRVVAQFGNSIAWRYLEAIRNELSGKPVKKRPRKTIQRKRKARLVRAKPQTQIINAPLLPPQTKNGQAASRLVSGTLEAIELLSGNRVSDEVQRVLQVLFVLMQVNHIERIVCDRNGKAEVTFSPTPVIVNVRGQNEAR